jgi:hypothetical protein
MKDKAFISSSDSNYFPLLLEWVKCIRNFKESSDFDICIFNAGMTNEQIEIIKPFVDQVKDIEWPCPIPSGKVRNKEYLKACIARPWIPEIFPEYKTYFWMDADTWVQNWEAIELFIKGSEKNKITLTGQVDRSYPRQIRLKWLLNWPWKVRGFYFSNAKKSFDFNTARQLLPYHVLLAGAFCMRRDAPHWKRWQQLVSQAVLKGKVFTAEQTSLGVLCYIEGFEYEILPGWCHWLCEFKPLWDEKNRKFIEPYLPHKEIGILHLSGFDEMRLNRDVTTEFQTPRGNTVKMNFRYPLYDGEKLKDN